MSISIDPEKFAELVVKVNPSKSEDVEDMAKESPESYINACCLVKRYFNIATNRYDTTETLPEIKKADLQLK